MKRRLFDLGSVVVMPAAMKVLEEANVFFLSLVARHVRGDFGQIHADETASNREAIDNGERMFSSYRVGNQDVWVITEADRNTTTIRVPFDD